MTKEESQAVEDSWTVTPMFIQETMLDWIAKGCTRNALIYHYAWAILGAEKVCWKTINTAIINRWSPSGLNYIKEKAWKLIKEKQEQEKASLSAPVEGEPDTKLKEQK